jgi:hypothetical protein
VHMTSHYCQPCHAYWSRQPLGAMPLWLVKHDFPVLKAGRGRDAGEKRPVVAYLDEDMDRYRDMSDLGPHPRSGPHENRLDGSGVGEKELEKGVEAAPARVVDGALEQGLRNLAKQEPVKEGYDAVASDNDKTGSEEKGPSREPPRYEVEADVAAAPAAPAAAYGGSVGNFGTRGVARQAETASSAAGRTTASPRPQRPRHRGLQYGPPKLDPFTLT